MKKLLFLMISIFLFANKINETYLNYVSKLIHYHFELENFDKIKPPFETKKISLPKIPEEIAQINNKKEYNLTLLSILNNEAYFLIKEFEGDKLVKIYKKWVKVDDNIANCKVMKINFFKVVLKCKNKIKIKTVNTKILGLKEKK